MSKLIPLSGNKGKGLYATVDDDMFETLSKHSWHLAVGKYASMRTKDGLFLMHRVVIGAKKGQEVDHIDGDGLNNRRYNLRICTHRQNVWNSRPYGRSGYRGVVYTRGKFVARINANGVSWSRSYPTALEAAKAYNRKAQEVYGEFAWLNPV